VSVPVYAVAQIRIDDRERYREYEAGFLPIFQKYGGELVAVDDAPRLAEGEWPYTRLVVLRFEDADQADAWYRSDEYQELMKIRQESSQGVLLFAQGLR
jgi:uncharacterized protein (DUF1330 family)